MIKTKLALFTHGTGKCIYIYLLQCIYHRCILKTTAPSISWIHNIKHALVFQCSDSMVGRHSFVNLRIADSRFSGKRLNFNSFQSEVLCISFKVNTCEKWSRHYWMDELKPCINIHLFIFSYIFMKRVRGVQTFGFERELYGPYC